MPWKCIKENRIYRIHCGLTNVYVNWNRENGEFHIFAGGYQASHYLPPPGNTEKILSVDEPEFFYKLWSRFRLEKGLPDHFYELLDHLFIALHIEVIYLKRPGKYFKLVNDD
ncbi:MAG: hypothetical protein WCT08_02535 [Patescibacteria group bacterium]|jgi:hypothetical protein